VVALAALLLAAAIAATAALSAAACVSVPLLHSCPRTTGPPVNASFGVAASSYDTATVTGTIEPHGLATSYYVAYGRGSGSASFNQRTAVTRLASLSAAHSVTVKLTGLLPVSRYGVELVAENSAGSATTIDSFTTTTVSPVRVDFSDVRASKTVITMGDSVSLSGHVSGAGGYPLTDYGYVEVHALSDPQTPRGSGLSFESVPADGDLEISNLMPVENTQFRLQAGASTSTAVTVYVLPTINIRVRRGPRKQASVTATVTVGAHPLSRHDHLAPVDFYRAATRTGSAVLFGSRVLVPVSARRSRSFTASITFQDPDPVFIFVCSHGPLISNMGPPSTGRLCGQPSLHFSSGT
jgi:hypothetical protein